AGRVETLDLAGDLNRIFAGVEERDLANAGLAFQHGGPGTGRVEPDGGYRPQPGYDDALHACGNGLSARATSRSLRVTTCASRLVRRIRPDSTCPGPISRNSALPRVTISRTDAVRWAGLSMLSAISLRLA